MDTTTATGKFDVKINPLEAYAHRQDAKLGRMSIDKTFHGSLEAVSQGEMLSAMTAVKGSAGYVAIEHVTGTLNGKGGSFVLQHSATMNRGTPQLLVSVVPDSGTDELTGLSGMMTIEIVEGQHSYTFQYSVDK